jgi:TatD DNase family protein
MIEWIDAHTHLDAEELFPKLGEVLLRAGSAGVRKMLLVNSETSEESFERTLACLKNDSEIQCYASFGVHPHHARFYDETLERRLLAVLGHDRVVGFGEIGLDFYYDNSPRNAQEQVFRRQLQLAMEKRLPIIIHCRDAYEKLLEILLSQSGQWRGMIHCFTGTPQQAEELMQLGFFISFSGIVTFPKATVLQESAQIVPPDRILIETDAPYLAPVPHRGKTNEPAFIADTARFIAALKRISEEELSRYVFRNFSALFQV